MTELRAELPELPERMKSLRVDPRGYPVPWFCAWLDDDENQVARYAEGAHADFRIIGGSSLMEAVRENRCWICGGVLGKFRAYVIGPMCAVNRVNSEPPSHVECADFAGRACPFLSRPHMRRRDTGLPEGTMEAAGIAVDRNPKACAVWIVQQKRLRAKRVPGGILFDLPDPHEVRWYSQGRRATVEEIEDSIETGLPELRKLASDESEVAEIEARVRSVRDLVAATA